MASLALGYNQQACLQETKGLRKVSVPLLVVLAKGSLLNCDSARVMTHRSHLLEPNLPYAGDGQLHSLLGIGGNLFVA